MQARVRREEAWLEVDYEKLQVAEENVKDAEANLEKARQEYQLYLSLVGPSLIGAATGGLAKGGAVVTKLLLEYNAKKTAVGEADEALNTARIQLQIEQEQVEKSEAELEETRREMEEACSE